MSIRQTLPLTIALVVALLALAGCDLTDQGDPETGTATSQLGGIKCGTPNNCYVAGASFTVIKYDPVTGQNVSYPPHAYQDQNTINSTCWAACGSVTQNERNHTGCGIQDPGPNPGNKYYAQCEYAP